MWGAAARQRLVVRQAPWRVTFGTAAKPGTAASSISASGLARLLVRLGFRGVRAGCTVTGGVTLLSLGALGLPYVRARAPLTTEERDEIFQDALVISEIDHHLHPSRVALSSADIWEALTEGLIPNFTYRDLQHPWTFAAFEAVARATFAFYSDAAGVMTSEEFRCSMHKMIDVVLELQSLYQGQEAPPARVRAAAVRELTSTLAPGVFRVLDHDGSGTISAGEYTRGAIVLVAALQGAPAEAPLLAGLAFRVVDADGDGLVSLADLTPWVALALEHGAAPPGADVEPRGPFGIFGTRHLTPAQLARRWMKHADFDQDGKLTDTEFVTLAPRLCLHKVICEMARKWNSQRLPPSPLPVPPSASAEALTLLEVGST